MTYLTIFLRFIKIILGLANKYKECQKGVNVMLKPLEDYVALTLEKEEKTTSSGIILTSEAKEKQAVGRVVAIGPKVEELNEGDRVIYQSYSGTKVELDDEEYLLIQVKNILAKLI